MVSPAAGMEDFDIVIWPFATPIKPNNSQSMECFFILIQR
jgi:hypothetical protein